MAQWSEGYVTEVEYIADCFPELAPAHLDLALLHRGIAFPDTHAGFNYLELGFGQGVTLTMLAAAQPQGRFFGNDFNPSHVLGARALAESARLDNLTLFEDSFAELAARDLPPMDYIVLHGIYSWVSAENRGHIVALIHRLLKTGGVVYVSYNAQPGWAPKAPMQRAMMEFAARHGAETLAERFSAARDFLQSLSRAGAAYFAHNPVAQEQLDGLWDLNDAYLVHEFASENWVALHHADVVRDMAAAKLSFAGSSTLANNFPLFSIPPEIAALYQSAEDPAMREMIRDFAVNTQFRRDIFVRGARHLDATALDGGYRDLRVALRRPLADCAFEARLPVGTVNLDCSVCEPILAELAKGPRSVAELAALPGLAKVAPSTCVDSVNLLLCLRYLVALQPREMTALACERTQAINQAMMARAVAGRYVAALASPLIGSGIEVDRGDVLFLAARAAGASLPEFAWAALQRAGVCLTHEGKTLEGDAANLQELQRRAGEFEQSRLPLYRTLGIA